MDLRVFASSRLTILGNSAFLDDISTPTQLVQSPDLGPFTPPEHEESSSPLFNPEQTEIEPEDIVISSSDEEIPCSVEEENVVKKVYDQFTPEEISAKIAQLITPPGVDVPVDVIFQSIEDLHKSCPSNLGDWYFSGNYPTPGGNKVVNKAFINYMEGRNVRGY